MDEQQGRPVATATTGNRWSDAISDDRQQELAGMLEAWEAPGTDHGNLKGPFDGWPLTGADVTWLFHQLGGDEIGIVTNLHLEGVNADVEFAGFAGGMLPASW